MADSILAAQGIRSSGPDGIGYAAGAGGTVTQATSKATGVTLNKICGDITCHNASLAAGAIVSFVVTNSTVAAGDMIPLLHVATGTTGAYLLNAVPAAGSFTLNIRNTTAAPLAEAIVIRFTVVRSVTA
jgi:hypothetical protein